MLVYLRYDLLLLPDVVAAILCPMVKLMGLRSLFAASLFTMLAAAQSFDVASIKRLPPTGIPGTVTRRGGALYMRGVTLGWAIRWAYNLQQYEIAVPDKMLWILWDATHRMPRYDIQAKSETAATAAELRPMLQRLLADRFALKFHYQERTADAWILRGGPAAQISRVESEDEGVFKLASGTWEVHHATMRELCDELSLGFRIAVLDQTELGAQRFDASVKVAGDPKAPIDDWIPAVVAGLRQLGFVVEKAKAPVRMLVVDSVLQTPSEN